jgi:hypothetical protein
MMLQYLRSMGECIEHNVRKPDDEELWFTASDIWALKISQL